MWKDSTFPGTHTHQDSSAVRSRGTCLTRVDRCDFCFDHMCNQKQYEMPHIQALAHFTKVNFISVNGSDLFSKYLGQSEAMVRQLFQQASEMSPCIVCFDELEALGHDRSDEANDGSGQVESRVLSTLLNEMDGVSARPGEVEQTLESP